MTKKAFSIFLFLVTLVASCERLYAQNSPQRFQLKKGEILDVLLLQQNPGTKADLQSYFQTALPVGKRMSYQTLTSFKVMELTEGNHRPELLILSKWDNMKVRKVFLEQIIHEVPDFHQRRRKIWSYFGLQYYELKADLSFEIDPTRYHVATTYWLAAGAKKSNYYDAWKEQLEKMGGQLLLSLQDGISPFGYRFMPHYFVLSSWESEAAFKAFQEKNLGKTKDNIQHLNEFSLQ